jgi:phospholipid/cholesterol/gamma-HCH transport system substrate-binding protein
VSRSKELLVGTVILLGTAVAVAGALWLSGGGFGLPTVPVDVLVADVGQLREGNQVKFRGVSVGRVSSFDVEPDGQGVRIHLLLDRELPQIEDPGAVVAPESLFGEWQVEIVSMSRFPRFSYFEVPEGARVPSGGVLMGGYALPDITRLTAAANDISQTLAVLTERVDRAFNDTTAQQVQRTFENIERLSEDLSILARRSSETFEEIEGEVRRATTDIGAAAAVARNTLERADEIMATGQVDTIVASVARGSQDMARIAAILGDESGGLAGTVESLDSTMARMDRLTARIEAGEGMLGQLIADGDLVDQASLALSQLELLLEDLRLNPKRYVRLSIF